MKESINIHAPEPTADLEIITKYTNVNKKNGTCHKDLSYYVILNGIYLFLDMILSVKLNRLYLQLNMQKSLVRVMIKGIFVALIFAPLKEPSLMSMIILMVSYSFILYVCKYFDVTYLPFNQNNILLLNYVQRNIYFTIRVYYYIPCSQLS